MGESRAEKERETLLGNYAEVIIPQTKMFYLNNNHVVLKYKYQRTKCPATQARLREQRFVTRMEKHEAPSNDHYEDCKIVERCL